MTSMWPEEPVIESAGIYGREDNEFRREVLVFPNGQPVDPITVEADEVLWVVMKFSEHDRRMLPINPLTDIHGAPPTFIS